MYAMEVAFWCMITCLINIGWEQFIHKEDNEI
jgi:hypothetical protein